MKQSYTSTLLSVLLALSFTFPSHAVTNTQCDAVFESGIGSHKKKTKLYMYGTSLIQTSNPISLKPKSYTTNCNYFNCTPSGEVTPKLDFKKPKKNKSKDDLVPWQYQPTGTKSEYDTIQVESGKPISLIPSSGRMEINEFSALPNAEVTFHAGVYEFIEFQLSADAKIIIPPGDVVVFILSKENKKNKENNQFSPSSQTNVNGQPGQLLILSEGDISLGSNSQVNAFIYTKKEFNMFGGTLKGAVNAGDDVEMTSNALIIPATPILKGAASEYCASVAQSPTHNHISFSPTVSACETPSATIKTCMDSNCNDLSSEPSIVSLNMGGSTKTVEFTGQIKFDYSAPALGTNTVTSTSSSPELPLLCNNGSCTITGTEDELSFFNTVSGNAISTDEFIAGAALSELGLRASESCGPILNTTATVKFSYYCQTENVNSLCTEPFIGSEAINGVTRNISEPLFFNEKGEADFSNYTFDDANIVYITASIDVDGAKLSSPNTQITFKPHSLLVETSNDDVHTAGDDFSLTVTAKGFNGTVLASYQPSSFSMELLKNTPSGGVSGYVNLPQRKINGSTFPDQFQFFSPNFIDGIMTETVYLSEIGAYSIQVNDHSYAEKISSNAHSLGRSKPSYFSASWNNKLSTEPACGTFTYIGQPFDFNMIESLNISLQPMNAKGDKAHNYIAEHAFYSHEQDTINAAILVLEQDTDKPDLTNHKPGTVLLSENYNEGEGNYVISIISSSWKTIKPVIPIEPYTPRLKSYAMSNILTDEDGVCYKDTSDGNCLDLTSDEFTGNNHRFGRINLQPTFGSEFESLQVPLFTETYLNGTFNQERDDSCTYFSASTNNRRIDFSNHSNSTLETIDMETIAEGLVLSGKLSSPNLEVVAPMFNGKRQQGIALITLDHERFPEDSDYRSHLTYDWDQNGIIDEFDNPATTIDFGLYRGNDRLLHHREVFR